MKPGEVPSGRKGKRNRRDQQATKFRGVLPPGLTRETLPRRREMCLIVSFGGLGHTRHCHRHDCHPDFTNAHAMQQRRIREDGLERAERRLQRMRHACLRTV